MGGDDKDDKDDEVKDGGKHDISRDGQTGKTADDIDPDKYGTERFIPDRIWVDEHDDGHDVALDRASEPERWRAAVYSDHVIVTQFDDGTTVWPDIGHRPTSSCSMPSAVLGMLDALDVHEGMRVLEIGTGTGYNAALLAARLGDDHVITVEIDPALTDQARSALASAGCTSTVVCSDGAAGWPGGAAYGTRSRPITTGG